MLPLRILKRIRLNYCKQLFRFSFFTDYQLQKASGCCHEAAKSFSYIVLCFDNPEILEEIKVLVTALKMADKNEKITDENIFYVNMFQHMANGKAGQKIIMLLTTDSDSDFTYIRIMKKFSKNFNLSIHAVSVENVRINAIIIINFISLSLDCWRRFSLESVCHLSNILTCL